jgi:PAS domain S-box-containing protein
MGRMGRTDHLRKAQELNLNPFTLSFPKHLEKNFLEAYNYESVSQVRVSYILAFSIFAVFGFLDLSYGSPEIVKNSIIRYAIICPILIGAVLLTYTTFFPKILQLINACLIVLVGIAIITMMAISNQAFPSRFYLGLIILLFWGFTFVRERFIWASISSIIIFIIFELSIFAFIDHEKGFLIGGNFFLIGSLIVSMFAGYFIELSARKNYYLTSLLKKEEEKVRRANINLEQKINERTSELLTINKELQSEIVDRKKAEDVLIKSEEKYRSLTENIKVGVYRTTPGEKGQFIEVNPTFLEMFGYKSKEELLKINVIDLYVHPKERQKFTKKLLQQGFIQNEEINLIRKDGVTFLGSISAIVVTDNNGKVMSYDGIIEDVTHQRQSEETIRESMERYRTLFETANDALFLMDGEKFIDCNKKTLEMFNCTRTQIIGKPPYLFSPAKQPDGRESKEKALEKINAVIDGQPQFFEWRHCTYDKIPFDAEVSLNLLELKKGKFILAIVRNIEERKRAEQVQTAVYTISEATHSTDSLIDFYKIIHDEIKKLMNTKNFYIAMYDDTNELLSFPYFVDEREDPPEPESLKKGLTEYVLSSAKPLHAKPKVFNRLLKQNKIELVGPRPVDWIGVPFIKDRKAFGVLVAQSYAKGEFYSDEDLNILQFVAGQVGMMIGRKQSEEGLIRSEAKHRKLSSELAETNELKEMLLDVITHDLKNPAGVIKGMSELAFDEDPANEMLEIIQNASEGLLQVISNAATLSSLSVGDTIELEKIDLVQIIKNVIGEYAPFFKTTDLELITKLPDALIVSANPIISEVFRNYISNAIKYGSIGKKIILSSHKTKNHVTVSVMDFGNTIDKQDYELIFERKRRLENKKRGRGLGLAIVKKIAEAHKAHVGVKANKPKGNIFYIKIPVSSRN